MQLRVALYLRVSLDPTGERLAVTRQRADCRAFAKARGWVVVGEYVDNSVSATAGKRPDWDRLLLDARAGAFDVVLAWAADRLVRRLSDLEALMNTGVRAATVQGDLDLTTPQGELTATMLAAVARAEVRQKSERQRAANAQRRAAGAPPVGPRGLGWKPDGMTVVRGEAKAVAGAFEALLRGTSLRSIAHDLNAAGFTTTRGNPWTAETVGRVLLSNPRYAALNRDGTKGGWPAVVDEDTFRAAAAILRDPARRSGRDSSVKHLLSNLAECGRCGARVKSAWTSTTGGQSARRVYRCSAAAHLTRAADPLDADPDAEPPGFVPALVVARMSRPDAAELFEPEPPDLAPVHAEAAALRARQDALAVEFADGGLTASQLRVATERLAAKLSVLDGELARHTRTAELEAFEGVSGEKEARQVWAAASVEQRRTWIRALMRVTLLPAVKGRRTFDPTTVRIDWNRPQ